MSLKQLRAFGLTLLFGGLGLLVAAIWVQDLPAARVLGGFGVCSIILAILVGAQGAERERLAAAEAAEPDAEYCCCEPHPDRPIYCDRREGHRGPHMVVRIAEDATYRVTDVDTWTDDGTVAELSGVDNISPQLSQVLAHEFGPVQS